jgi:leader peptidase (prepilin peptidase) / N-methyltransferase
MRTAQRRGVGIGTRLLLVSAPRGHAASTFPLVTAFVAAASGVLGLLVGSFLNVVVWRVPRRESVLQPASHCPECDHGIAPYDNIPVVSWLLLRARCRNCGAHISARYPMVELLTGVLFAAVGARFSDSWVLPAYLAFTAGLIALALIDLDHFLLPNRVMYPVGFVSVPLLFVGALIEDEPGAFGRALLAGLVAFAVFFVLHTISPRGLAFGDVRLSFLLGVFLGFLSWWHVFFGLFTGFLYGAVVGVVLVALGRRSRKQHIPFGPFLAAGTLTIVLVGQPIIDWYR